MAIKDSGSSLAISEIVTEFGGSTPHSLSEYYAGGSNVPSGTTGESGSIPTSGTISMSQFYGSSNRIAIALTISGTTQNYNIYANRGGTYSAGSSDVTLTVQAIVGSTGASAIDTGNQWTSGDTIKIINNSQIVGKAGAGGAGGISHTQPGAAGGAGQAAINLGYPVTIQNNGGFIRGGGGGGGGGAGATLTQPGGGSKGQTPTNVPIGGGGGGGGQGQQGGAAGAAGPASPFRTAQAGQAGSISGAGNGGNSSNGADATAQKGGNGGGFGSAGQAGDNRFIQQGTAGTAGAGGAAGKAINLNSNQVTYEDGSGNIQGAVS